MLGISAYMGKNIADRLDGIEKECYNAAWEWMEYAWGDNVEFQRLSTQILLCDETREHLYGGGAPELRYKRGERPQLDRLGDEICAGLESEREKVLAILTYIRDMHKKVGGADYFYGGTEEELIKKSEWFCERVARVMVALCETQGIAGRIIFHIGAGHLTNEIYLEGGWGYFDPRCGMFCVDENDRFMSVDDIVKDRDAIYRQPKWVTDYHAEYWSLDYRQHRNYHFCFSPYELQCIGDYSLADADKYNFEWVRPYSGGGNERTPQDRYSETGMMLLVR